MIAQTHEESSRDISVFWGDVASFWRDMMIMKTSPDPAKYLDLTESEYAALYDAAKAFTMNQIAYHVAVIDEAAVNMSRSPQTRRRIAEFAVLRLVSPQFEQSPDALLSRISELEEKVALLEMGVVSTPPSVPEENPADRPGEPADDVPAAPESDEPEDDEPSADESEADGDDDDFTDVPDPSVIVEKLGAEVKAFVKDAQISINSAGDRMRVIVSNDFAQTMLESPTPSGQLPRDTMARAALLAKYASTLPDVEIKVAESPVGDQMKFEF